MAESNFLLFKSADQILALEAEYSRQVVPLEQLYGIPGVSGAILGLIPAAGRALPVIDLVKLVGLGSGAANSLALICEIDGESLALPVEQVIGFVREEVSYASDLLSEEMLIGGYFGGGHKGRVINPNALMTALQNRVLSA